MVFANYKVAEDASEVFFKASEYWNNQRFKVGDYNVEFNITDQADANGKYLNTIDIKENPNADDKITRGVTDKGKEIHLYDKEPTVETAVHEIGHTLGLSHYKDDRYGDPSSNIMYYNGYNRGTELRSDQVQDSLNHSKLGKEPNWDYASDGRTKVYCGRCVTPTIFGTNYKKNNRKINKK